MINKFIKNHVLFTKSAPKLERRKIQRHSEVPQVTFSCYICIWQTTNLWVKNQYLILILLSIILC